MRLALILAATLLAPTAYAQPAFSVSFSPDAIGPGSTTTLVYTIDNAGGGTATDLAFSNALPAGVTVATPAALRTSCGNPGEVAVVAPEGGSTVSLSSGEVVAGVTCTVRVNVTSTTPGTVTNTTGDLTSSAGNSGSASDDLTVSTARPGFSKSFAPSMVSFQGRSRLTFVVDNTLNGTDLTAVNFSDTFPAGMRIADPANVTATCRGTRADSSPPQITATPGSGSFTYNYFGFDFEGFHAVLAGQTCFVAVDVIGGTVGVLDNVSSALTAQATNGLANSGKAGARLEVIDSRLPITKAFTDDPAAPGGTVTVEYLILNLNRSQTATEVAFTDDLDAALSGLTAVGLPAAACGGTVSSPDGGSTLELTNGSLPAEGACTFSVTLGVPTGAAPGTYPSITSAVTGTVGGNPVMGPPATDDLVVSAAPRLTQTYIDDPVAPGGMVTLEFTLTNASPSFEATNIAFTEAFEFLPVPAINSITPPANGFCGPGASLSGSPDGTGIQVNGASLAAGASCTFSITISVPEATTGGVYTTTTSDVTGTVNGEAVSGSPASADLTVIAAPQLAKSFVESAAAPGDATPLQFTLTLSNEASGNATAIAFTDDLDAALTGLAAQDLPIAACGGTLSSADGGSTLEFAGGALTPGETCEFSVVVTVPETAPTGTITNTTSVLSAQVHGSSVTTAAASADLLVSPVRFSKVFTDDPVDAGDTVTLEFTIENTDPANTVSGLFFTDNLSAALNGLASTSGDQPDVCGSGSLLQGTTFLILTGGTLAPGETCTFSVSAAVPANAADGVYFNTTSPLNANSGVVAAPATAPLVVGEQEPTVTSVTSSAAEGWRMMAPPIAGLAVQSLAEINLVEGVAGDPSCEDAAPNLLVGYTGFNDSANTPETYGGFNRPSGYGDVLERGRGFFWYFWDDPADAGPCGDGPTASSVQPLPVVISATGPTAEQDVTTTFADAERAQNEDTFYLAGNPFGEGLDLDGTAAGLASIRGTDANGAVAFQNTVHIWDAAAGGYVTRTAQTDGGTNGSGGTSPADNVSVWQGIWLERRAAARPAYPLTLTYDADYRTGDDGTFVGRTGVAVEGLRTLRFEVAGTIGEQSVFDGSASVLFADGAGPEWDAYDASKLGGFAWPYALLAPVGQDRDGALAPKAAESLALDVAGSVTVPLAFLAAGDGAFELRWPETATIPDDWSLTLLDGVTGETVDLRTASAYAFTSGATQGWAERFSVTVAAPLVGTADRLRDGYAVGTPYPNPVQAAATVRVEVAEAQHVQVEVYNVLGQRLAVVHDAELAPGAALAATVDASGLAVGTYVVRVTGEAFVETRRLTVAR